MSLSNTLTRTIVDYSNPKSIAFQFRSKRIANLIKIILQVYEQKGSVKILDIGGTKLYWRILSEHILEKYKVHITIANLPGTGLAPAENHYKFIHADGCNLDTFPDNSFDVVHANSVIEHVGDWNNMLKFATEVQRVAPNLYIQTPYFWFPIEPHFMCPFFHWFPRPVRIALIMKFDLGNHKRSQTLQEAASKLENYRLLDKPMLQALFPKAVINHERLLGLTKSLVAIYSTFDKQGE